MTKRKTSDVALISISPQHLEKAQKAIKGIKSTRWAYSYTAKHGKLLVRRRATKRWSKKVASGLETALQKALPRGSYQITWSWTAGGEEFYFPGSEIMVLFEPGTSQAERKRILGKIKGVKVTTQPDFNIEAPAQPKKHIQRRQPAFPGVPKSKQSQVMRIWETLYPDFEQEKAPTRPSKIRVPVARVSVPQTRREELFEIAEKIKALPKIRAATPDLSLLGKNIRPRAQQGELPSLSDESIHRRNRIDFAWRLINPDELSEPDGPFLVTRDKVAVIEWNFSSHPFIEYELIGYDTADQDQDPLSPQTGGDMHGLWMSGVIGGTAQYDRDLSGVAPGAVIVPFRVRWITSSDFNDDNQYTDYQDFLARYTTNWVNTIIRLHQLSLSGLEIANMSFDDYSQVWRDEGTMLAEWMNWWLRDGSFGRGVFAAASAGNDETYTDIATPADVARVFAVGSGDWETYTNHGSTGMGLELLVDEGLWPMYFEDQRVLPSTGLSGATSVGSAVVAGVAAILQALNPTLTADEIKSILRQTTRKIWVSTPPEFHPGTRLTGNLDGSEAWDGAGPGYSVHVGHGFLNAHHAAEVAWRNKHPVAEVKCLKYMPDLRPRALIQQRASATSLYAGKRLGRFWSLCYLGGTDYQQWTHDRDFGLSNGDQAIDRLGLPFGEFFAAGDFDGDRVDEIALQLHYDEFWPQICEHPAHCMLTFKYDETEARWVELGARSPYAQGLAAPQVVFPPNQPLRGIFTADLMGDEKDCLVVWGGETISALHYDQASNTFLRLDPAPYSPSKLSPVVDAATGSGNIIDQRILKAAPLSAFGKTFVFIVSSFIKLGSGAGLSAQPELEAQPSLSDFSDRSGLPGVHPPLEPPTGGDAGGAGGRQLVHQFMTVSILEYDSTTSQWANRPFSSNPENTHILLDEDAIVQVETILVDDFTHLPTNDVVIHLANDHLHTLLLSNHDDEYISAECYRMEIVFEDRISSLKSGRYGLDGMNAQLVCLSGENDRNAVRFYKWNNTSHIWQDAGSPLFHGRNDNTAIDLSIVKIPTPNFDGVGDVIALLFEKPDANIYLTYRYSETEGFHLLGIL